LRPSSNHHSRATRDDRAVDVFRSYNEAASKRRVNRGSNDALPAPPHVDRERPQRDDHPERESFWQDIAKGGLLVIAVVIQQRRAAGRGVGLP
jgi:hypothetical protein